MKRSSRQVTHDGFGGVVKPKELLQGKHGTKRIKEIVRAIVVRLDRSNSLL
jgi:hypothetical protein